MPVATRRTAQAGQGDEPASLDSVELPLVDLPEWVENTFQVVSFGAFTPRSTERRAIEAAARIRRETSASVAVALDYEEYQEGSAALPSPPQQRKSPRLLSTTTILRALDAKEARLAEAKLKAGIAGAAARAADAAAKATGEAAAAARLAAADDSDEVDEILKSRAAKLKRARKRDNRAQRAREAEEASALSAAEAASGGRRRGNQASSRGR